MICFGKLKQRQAGSSEIDIQNPRWEQLCDTWKRKSCHGPMRALLSELIDVYDAFPSYFWRAVPNFRIEQTD